MDFPFITKPLHSRQQIAPMTISEFLNGLRNWLIHR